ncbi:MAG: bifunctional 23S rRNA (guanine(2069)-N(7))-methyltransferase RlmK/23S rRNA (guanine(2445)-N(2))-methyltransferase RlmL [Planctomycetia bacterium]|nr:bifunctional 23S rRNA (guanine(2069)-N(7))-methyltransferase RlmK/23S rRNA (guanine(2445)-N(2))-methyltransferase RlmL [Planctomycetia bacterium]
MAESFDMIAKTFFGLEGTLAEELLSLGAQNVQLGRRMVSFRGDMRLMMWANICCRTAVRILKPIATFSADDERALYRGIGLIDWLEHLDAERSLAIDPVVHGPVFSNSLYAAQLAKDAVVDQIRDRTGRRPSVDLVDPDLRINLHIDQNRVTVYLDSSGESLHKRGYRAATGEAPINEVLAAGILRLTEWDENSPLVDFMCGSGTFLIEAALMARRIAPGLARKHFGYERWKDFDRRAHESLVAEARQQVRSKLAFPIRGSDLDPQVIAAARENGRRAGVADDVQFGVESFEVALPPAADGVLVTNPPYDERMKTSRIESVYRRIGDALKHNWAGYTAFIFTGNLNAGKQIGLRSSAKTRLFNGPIECRLLKFALFALMPRDATESHGRRAVVKKKHEGRGQEQADAFRNRLARMAKHWHRWARRQGITCYRIYDRDAPEIPLAIDWYEGRVAIIEYDRPHNRTDIEHRAWLDRMVELVSNTLSVRREHVTLKTKGTGVFSGKDSRPLFVQEAGLRYHAHLAAKETGLAVDQRILRALLRAEATDKRFLNLFARTGTHTVAAAAGGTGSTISVEASPNLADWAKKNLRLNRLPMAQHQVICQDPLVYSGNLDPAAGPQFDLAFVEPPSFDGKRRDDVWNVQDGHVELLNRLVACLSVGGKIYFVSRFRRLTFHADQIRGASVREITRQTVPPDFRNKKVHRSWVLIRTPTDQPG